MLINRKLLLIIFIIIILSGISSSFASDVQDDSTINKTSENNIINTINQTDSMIDSNSNNSLSIDNNILSNTTKVIKNYTNNQKTLKFASNTSNTSKQSVNINTSKITTYSNTNIVIKANITYSNGTPINNTKVVFKINSLTIGYDTVKNGVVSLDYYVKDFKSGIYNITIKIGESSTHLDKQVNTTLTVLKSPSQIICDNLTVIPSNSNVTLNFTITDLNNLSISGKAAFKIDGSTIGIVSVKNGKASITFNDTYLHNATTYNLSMVYGGSSIVDSARLTTYLRVVSTISQYNSTTIFKAANSTKVFIEANHRLPNYVTLNGDQISVEDFLYLMCSMISSNTYLYRGYFDENVQTLTTNYNKNITSSSYTTLAKEIVNSYIVNGTLKEELVTSDCKLSYGDAVYLYSRVLAYKLENNVYPSKAVIYEYELGAVTVLPSTNTVSSSLTTYLSATTNCQVNNATIKQLASSIKNIYGTSSAYRLAKGIFTYLNDATDYEYYTNTRYGAVSTWNRKQGNCVDLAHLIIAVARASNIPARYCHAKCYFSSGLVTGHVWAQLYVQGQWYNCDLTSYKNGFGNIVNWYKSGTITRYQTLPF